ncbi:TPA: glycosyltransferase family 61 protein, partial [Streptococcus pneumoniae]|nr:glycosyltransferase family 61 protein [Streptococcus pneumoniae]
MNKYEERYQENLSKNDFYKLINKSYLSDKELQVQQVKAGIVLPPKAFETKLSNKLGLQKSLHGKGGVVDSNGNYIELSAQKAVGMRNRVYGPYKINYDNLPIRNEKVIYLNYFIKQWGHFLLDVVGRLWYPLLQDNDTKLVYTCYAGTETKIEGNYLEFLKLLGIDQSRLIMINCPTQFSEVIIPESSILPGGYYTKEYKQLFSSVVENIKLDKYDVNAKMIYCSRSKLGIAKSKEFGEDGIEGIFKQNGYTSVYMETMSLEEQIKTLLSAKTIVLTSGSLAHNLLFVNKDIDVFILNKTYRVNLHQFLINEISDATVRFVDIYRSPLPILYGYGPFLMDLTKPLANFLDDNE